MDGGLQARRRRASDELVGELLSSHRGAACAGTIIVEARKVGGHIGAKGIAEVLHGTDGSSDHGRHSRCCRCDGRPATGEPGAGQPARPMEGFEG